MYLEFDLGGNLRALMRGGHMGRSVRTPLPPKVDEIRAKFERWRQQRKCLGPMPEKLSAETAELASRFGMNPICHHMVLSYAALKTRLGNRPS